MPEEINKDEKRDNEKEDPKIPEETQVVTNHTVVIESKEIAYTAYTGTNYTEEGGGRKRTTSKSVPLLHCIHERW